METLLIASKWSFFRYYHALSVNCAGPPTEIHFPPVGLFWVGIHDFLRILAHIRMFAKDAQTRAMDSSSFHARTIPSKGLSEKMPWDLTIHLQSLLFSSRTVCASVSPSPAQSSTTTQFRPLQPSMACHQRLLLAYERTFKDETMRSWRSNSPSLVTRAACP